MRKTALVALAITAAGSQAFAGRDVRDRTTSTRVPISAQTLLCNESGRIIRPYGEPDYPAPTTISSQVTLRLDPPLKETFSYGALTATYSGRVCAKVSQILANAPDGVAYATKTVHTEVSTFPSYTDCRTTTSETVTLNFGEVTVKAQQSKTDRAPIETCDL